MKEKKPDISITDFSEKIIIYSTEDEKIKSIGKLLSADTAVAILQTLFENTLTANEISKKTEISLPLVLHYLEMMQDSKMISIAKIGKSTKQRDMKYYSASKFALLILPPDVSEKAKRSKILKRSFQIIYKMAVVGISSVATWFAAQYTQESIRMEIKPVPSPEGDKITSIWEGLEFVQSDVFWSTVSSIIVLSIGLLVIWRINKKKI